MVGVEGVGLGGLARGAARGRVGALGIGQLEKLALLVADEDARVRAVEAVAHACGEAAAFVCRRQLLLDVDAELVEVVLVVVVVAAVVVAADHLDERPFLRRRRA